MKLYRGDWAAATCSKKPKDYLDYWMRGNRIPLDATVNGIEKKTTVFLELEEADVLALFHALIERYQRSAARAQILEDKLKKIMQVSRNSDTPSDDRLLEIRAIARRAEQ